MFYVDKKDINIDLVFFTQFSHSVLFYFKNQIEHDIALDV